VATSPRNATLDPTRRCPLHLEARVVILPGELEQLAADCARLVELSAVEVERGQAAQHRKPSRELSDVLGECERTLERLFRLLRIAADREEPSGDAHAKRDLLLGAIRRRRNG
jgi:hypothetical protein